LDGARARRHLLDATGFEVDFADPIRVCDRNEFAGVAAADDADFLAGERRVARAAGLAGFGSPAVPCVSA
jgi:hypothetical protein